MTTERESKAGRFLHEDIEPTLELLHESVAWSALMT